MSGLVPVSAGLWGMVQSQGGGIPSLISRPLVALECQVAGTSFRHLQDIEPDLAIGQRFHLQREPDNEHDEWAVAIYCQNKTKLGYLPRDSNETVARLMDAGKYFYADLLEKNWEGNWLKLWVQVVLQD